MDCLLRLQAGDICKLSGTHSSHTGTGLRSRLTFTLRARDDVLMWLALVTLARQHHFHQRSQLGPPHDEKQRWAQPTRER